MSVLGVALAGCQKDEGFKFGWFYRMVVELSYDNQPLDIDVVIACASETRSIPGEGRSARAIWAPYIFGVRTKAGEGVLVQSPDICGRELAKQPMPADFMPVVFWAPDAGNPEFLVAYLNEQAYGQPVSKLKFGKARFTEVTAADYETWRQTKWKDNIVPIGPRGDDHLRGASFFRGDGFFPKGDPRNEGRLRMSCHAFLRVPIPAAAQNAVRERWPDGKPEYWLLDWPAVNAMRQRYRDEFKDEARRRGLWDREEPGALPSFWDGKGVNRRSGLGHIEEPQSSVASGQGLRIPYRVDTGYPWASERLRSQTSFDVHVDTANGADRGFAYCYRDMYMHYFFQPQGRATTPTDRRVLIDNRLIGTWPHVTTDEIGAVIVERDEFLWLADSFPFPLTHELARMQ